MTRLTVGIDIGGTFTDVVAYDHDDGRLASVKVPSTPPNLVDGFMRGLARILDGIDAAPSQVSRLIHGTTIATNAVLEQKGARLGILTTEGFQDVLIIGRQKRTEMYDLFIDAETPIFLAPRRRIRGIAERIDADGDVVRGLDEDGVRDAARYLVEEQGIESLAVCYLFSFRRPEHELRTASIISELYPNLPISLSCQVDPRFREYERLCVTAFDAYVRPVMARYIGELEARVGDLTPSINVQIMQSRGGISSAVSALEKPVTTLLSGPAAGVIGGCDAGSSAGLTHLITIDIGGTSSDVALVLDGRPLIGSDGKIGTFPLRQPMIDVNTIGAGGGSIAWIDPAGALRVGPQSAGSDPGPACYGTGGTQATVTDASLILGYLNPGFFAGGEISLDVEAARSAVTAVAASLGMDLDVAASGIHRIVNARMADQLRLVSIRRGHDPRQFALLPLGGAGPLHAGRLAEQLGIERVLIPPTPGVLSAFGLLVADVEHEHSVTFAQDAAVAEREAMRALFANLDAVCRERMARDHVPVDGGIVRWSCDMRYSGQSYELEVPLRQTELSASTIAAMVEDFHQRHEQVYGHANRHNRVEFVNLRSVHSYSLERPTYERTQTGSDAISDSRPDSRAVYFDEYQTRVETPVYRREQLSAGQRIEGPAIVEQSDTTTVIYPRWRAEVDAIGNLLMTLNPQEEGGSRRDSVH